MDEHGIKAPARTASQPKPSKKTTSKQSANGNTVLETFELYEQGKSIEEIATERGLTALTIESHLVKAYRMGLAVDPEGFIPEEQRSAIFAAIEEQGAELLKPIKDVLPEDITSTAIRFAVEIYKSQK